MTISDHLPVWSSCIVKRLIHRTPQQDYPILWFIYTSTHQTTELQYYLNFIFYFFSYRALYTIYTPLLWAYTETVYSWTMSPTHSNIDLLCVMEVHGVIHRRVPLLHRSLITPTADLLREAMGCQTARIGLNIPVYMLFYTELGYPRYPIPTITGAKP